MPRQRVKRDPAPNPIPDPQVPGDPTLPPDLPDPGLEFDPSVTSTSIDVPLISGTVTAPGPPIDLPPSTSRSRTSSQPPATDTGLTELTPKGATSRLPPAIPVGAVVGAVVGSICLLFVVVAFVICQSRRAKRARNRDVQKRRNYERRQSKREVWKTLDDDNDSGTGSMDTHMARRGNFKLKPITSPASMKEKDPSRPPQLSPLPFQEFHHAKAPSVTEPPPIPTRNHPYAMATGFTPTTASSELEPPTATSTTQFLTPRFPKAGGPGSAASSYSSPSPPGSSNGLRSLATGNTSHNHNPFFTAHPASPNVVERWGAVASERSVPSPSTMSVNSSTPLTRHPYTSPATRVPGASISSISSSNNAHAMENLIAALDLGSNQTSISLSSDVGKRSMYGHLGTVAEQDAHGDDASYRSAASEYPPVPNLRRERQSNMTMMTMTTDDDGRNPFEFDEEAYGDDRGYNPHQSAISTGSDQAGPPLHEFPMPPRNTFQR